MLKSELVKKLAVKNPHLYIQDLERIVNLVLDEISNTLREGGRVELRGFGAFVAKERSARLGRNPRNGATVEVMAKKALAFKASKEIHEQLNARPSPENSPAD